MHYYDEYDPDEADEVFEYLFDEYRTDLADPDDFDDEENDFVSFD